MRDNKVLIFIVLPQIYRLPERIVLFFQAAFLFVLRIVFVGFIYHSFTPLWRVTFLCLHKE